MGVLCASALRTMLQLARGITPNAEHVGGLQPFAIGGVVVALLGVFGGIRSGGGLLVTALAWLAAVPHLRAPPLRLLALVVLGQLLATVVGFLLSSGAPDVEVRTSATRLVEQFM